MKNIKFYKVLESVPDINSKLKIISDEIKSVFAPYGGYIALVDNYNKNLVIKHGFLSKEDELNSKVIRNTCISLEFKHPASDCVKSCRPVAIKNIKDAKYDSDVKILLENIFVKSGVYVPIEKNSEVIGCVFMYYNEIKDLEDESFKLKDLIDECFYQIKHGMLYSDLISKEKHTDYVLQRCNKILNLAINVCNIGCSNDFFRTFLNNFMQAFGFEFAALFLKGKNNCLKLKTTMLSDKKYSSRQLAFEKYFSTYPLYAEGPTDGILSIALKNKKHFYFEDLNKVQSLPLAKKDKDGQKILNAKSVLALPFLYSNEAEGIFAFWSFTKQIYLTAEDILAIKKLNSIIEVAYENSKLLKLTKKREKEIEKAKQIQSHLLPKSDDFDLNIEIYSNPLGGISSHMFDISKLKQKKFRLFLANTALEELEASLINMLIKAEYNKLKLQDISPDKVLTLLNGTFTKIFHDLDIYFTCFLADIDTENLIISYSSAGHIDQLILSDEKTLKITSGGKPIGQEQKGAYICKIKPLKKNDIVLLYTDTLIELPSAPNARFGEDKFLTTQSKSKNFKIHLEKIAKQTLINKDTKKVADDAIMIVVEI